jgi:hypothetical protein
MGRSLGFNCEKVSGLNDGRPERFAMVDGGPGRMGSSCAAGLDR